MTKVCLITCYNQPDYIRARTLRAAFESMPDVELIVVKNKHTGLLRYAEVFWKIILTRIRHHPDIYFQTFRAYETFAIFRLLTLGKPFIFDEFINPIEYFAYENHHIKSDGIGAMIIRLGYKLWLLTVSVIVTDTPSHVRYSAKLMNLSIRKYVPLIVSTDERVFVNKNHHSSKNKTFTVFYYGLYMMPLQGLDTIIGAMRLLKDQDIQLVLIGGKEKTKQLVQSAIDDGLHIDYKFRVAFEELPGYMERADVCLAGPFGNTVQAQYVVGGKTYQYMHMSKPVIIGRNEESHIWTDKQDGLIVPQADSRALADAIVWAKNHPTELAKMGDNGKKLYDRKLSNAVLESELRALLEDKKLL